MNLDTNINNDPVKITDVLDFIFDLIGGVIDIMQDINLFASVSLFDFCVALTVMSIVITYLVNVAKSPYVIGVSEGSLMHKRDRKYADDKFVYQDSGYSTFGASELPEHSRRFLK